MKLTNRQILAYSSGMAGWSVLINLMSVMLIYIYLPPSNAGLNTLIPPFVYLGVFSVLALIAAGGRLFDAIIDPLIAWMVTPAGLLRSTDDGRTFAPVASATAEKVGDVTALEVCPADERIILLGTDADGMFISTDAGRTWRPMPAPRVRTVTPAG